jgi:hypothetical protein
MTTICPESISGTHNEPNAQGLCTWCGRRIAGRASKPQRTPVSELTLAYRYSYDPDFGSDRDDVY